VYFFLTQVNNCSLSRAQEWKEEWLWSIISSKDCRGRFQELYFFKCSEHICVLLLTTRGRIMLLVLLKMLLFYRQWD